MVRAHPLLSLAFTVAIAYGAVVSDPSVTFGQEHKQECLRPAPRRFPAGTTTLVEVGSRPPCEWELRFTGVNLDADTDGRVADIRGRVVSDHRGTFVAATGFGQLARWRSDGSFIQFIGSQGQGPGELSPGGLNTFARAGAGFAIRDNSYRWSLFDSAGRFVRQFSATGMGSGDRYSTFIDSTQFVTAYLVGMIRPQHFFHLYDFSAITAQSANTPRGSGARTDAGPTHVRSFAPIPPDELYFPTSSLFRLISHAGGDSFWAGPPATVGRGYELELWSIQGERRRTLRRTAPWFPDAANRATPAREGGPPARTPTQITFLHDDGTGLLYVYIWVMSNRWRQLPAGTRAAEHAAMERQAQEVYFDVIDTNAGVLLASGGPFRADDPRGTLPMLIPGTRMGFVRDTTETGLPRMRQVEYRLVRR
jgi:hypothetical protein